MNVAVLALLPLLLLGVGAGLFAHGWLEAFAAASPSIAPPWWRALPPLLLAAGAGAWLGGWRMRPLRLAQSATWLALAAAGALAAPWLLERLAPAVPEPLVGGAPAAAWLGALLPLAAAGGAFVLILSAREACAERSAMSRAGSAAWAAAGAWLGWRLAQPGADGSAVLPVAATTAAAAALLMAGLGARLLAEFEVPDAGPRLADGSVPALAAALGLVAATAFTAVTLGLVVARVLDVAQLRLEDLGRGHSLPSVLAGLLVGALLLGSALRGRRAPAAGAPARRPFDVLTHAGILLALGCLGVHQLLAGGGVDDRPVFLLLVLPAPLALLYGLLLDDPRRPPPARAGLGLLALAAGAALAVAWPARDAAGIEPVPTGALFQRAAWAALLVLLLAVALAAPARNRLLFAARGLLQLLAAGCLIVLGVRDPAPLPWREDPPGARLLHAEEGLRGVATLVGLPDGSAQLRRDGRPLPGAAAGPLLLRRAGRLAAALKPDAQSAALLLRDDGALLAALSATSPARVTCVEPDTALVVLQPDLVHEPGQDARGGGPWLVAAEPRAWLLANPRSQDLVVQNVFEPDARDAQAWLTAEHFLALRGALREDGVAVVVLPLHLLPWPAFAAAGAAFVQAFPDARLLVASLRADLPLALLAGGLSRGLPGLSALDGLLGAVPSAAGPNGAADVYDAYVCDGWTLAARWKDESPATLAAPRAAWLAAGRAGDALALARINLRQLADLAVPLDTTSLLARPVSEKDARRLGAELIARSGALVGLLAARSSQAELDQAEPGTLSDAVREALEHDLHGALLHAWRSAPGHLDARDALLERAARLARDGRHESAATLLDLAVQVLPDPRLSGVLGGLLLRLERQDQALALLEPAHLAAPDDRSVSLNLACALLVAGRDAEAHGVLEGAARTAAPQPLPPVPGAVLGLLRGDVAAVAPARAVQAGLPPGDPWAQVLARLLRMPPAGGPPPGR